MVIMERRYGPLERTVFHKQLEAAIKSNALDYPISVKNKRVDIYQLYLLVYKLRRARQGDFSYKTCVGGWRKIAIEMGHPDEVSALILFRIYCKYVVEGVEQVSPSSAPLSYTASPPRDTALRRVQSAAVKRPLHRGASSPRPTTTGRQPPRKVVVMRPQQQLQQEREQVEKIEVPVGCKVEGRGSDVVIVDDGKLEKITGDPEQYEVQPVIRQLESGLPHEVQFGLNMLLWLTKTWSLPLPKYPRLLTALLANAGSLTHSDWENEEESSFWNETVSEEEQFFNSGHASPRTRAIQISTVLCNLCHTSTNVTFLLSSDSFLSFLFQGIKSSCIPLRNNVLDILAMLSSEILLSDVVPQCPTILATVRGNLHSRDRFLLLNGLELVANLCMLTCNQEQVLDWLRREDYTHLVRLLLVPDALVLHGTLEAIYTLTCIGRDTCEHFLLADRHAIPSLVSLLAIPAESLHHPSLRVSRYVERFVAADEERDLIRRYEEQEKRARAEIVEVVSEREEEVKEVVKESPRKAPPAPPAALTDRELKKWNKWEKKNKKKEKLAAEAKEKKEKLEKLAAEAKVAKDGTVVLSPAKEGLRRIKLPDGISEAEKYAYVWASRNLRKCMGKILMRQTVLYRYFQEVHNAEINPLALKDFFYVVKRIFPEIERRKESLNGVNVFVVENVTFQKEGTAAADCLIVHKGNVINENVGDIPADEPARPKTDLRNFVPGAEQEKAFTFEKSDNSSREESEDSSEPESAPGKTKKGLKKKKKEKKKGFRKARIVSHFIECELEEEPKIIMETHDSDGNIETSILELGDSPKRPEHPNSVRIFEDEEDEEEEEERKAVNPYDMFHHTVRNSEYIQYKKTLTLDLSEPTQVTKKVEKVKAVLRPKNVSPAFDKPSSPKFDGKSSPTFDNPSSPTFNNPSSPTFDKPSSPTFDKPSSPTFGKSASPTFGNPSSPTFDTPSSPTFNKPSSPTFDKISSPTFNKPSSPTFDTPSSPAFNKPSSPAFNKPSSPTFNKISSPTFNKISSPTFNKISSPTFDNPSSTTLNNPPPASPTFDRSPAKICNGMKPLSTTSAIVDAVACTSDNSTVTYTTTRISPRPIPPNHSVLTTVVSNRSETISERPPQSYQVVSIPQSTDNYVIVNSQTPPTAAPVYILSPTKQNQPIIFVSQPQQQVFVPAQPQVLLTNGAVLQPQPVIVEQQTVVPSSSPQIITVNPQHPLQIISTPPQKQLQMISPPKQIMVPVQNTPSTPAVLFVSQQPGQIITSSPMRSHVQILPRPSSDVLTPGSTQCTTVYSNPVISSVGLGLKQVVTGSGGQPMILSPVKVATLSPVKLMNGFRPAQVQAQTASIITEETNESNSAVPPPPKRRFVSLPKSRHPYPCFWKNCKGWFERSTSLAAHLMSVHFRESPTACQWLTCSEEPGTRSKFSLEFHLKNIHAKAPKLPSLPRTSLSSSDVHRALTAPPPWTDPPETAVTRSLHVLTALILRNFLHFTPELVGWLGEETLATVAMSSQEAGRTLCDVLAMSSGRAEKDSDQGVYVTHLPPFR